MTTGVQLEQQNVVRVYGTDGEIFVPEPWKPSELGGTSKIIVRKRGAAPEEIQIENKMHLYALEADAVAANTRTSAFAGILLQSSHQGLGHFNLATLPAPTTSPMLSGRVVLN